MAAGAAYGALAGYQIISGFQQAEMMRDNATLSREVNDFNADLAMIDSYEAQKNGYSQVARYQTTIDETLGAQKVVFAAQDVDVNFGTAGEVAAETKLKGYLNQMDIMNEANARAMGYKNEARNARLQGHLGGLASGVQANATRNAGLINAGVTATGYLKK